MKTVRPMKPSKAKGGCVTVEKLQIMKWTEILLHAY